MVSRYDGVGLIVGLDLSGDHIDPHLRSHEL